MPTLRVYAQVVTQITEAFGTDVGSGTAPVTWDDPSLCAGAPDNVAASANIIAGIPNGTWYCANLYFATFAPLVGASLSSLSPTYTLTELKATLNVKSCAVTPGTFLAYARVQSAATGLAKGVREGGFTITNGGAQNIALHNQTANPIIASRAGTPITMADVVGNSFQIVVGFLGNGTAASAARDLQVDGLTLDVSWTSSPTADRAPVCSGLLANRFRRYSRS